MSVHRRFQNLIPASPPSRLGSLAPRDGAAQAQTKLVHVHGVQGVAVGVGAGPWHANQSPTALEIATPAPLTTTCFEDASVGDGLGPIIANFPALKTYWCVQHH